MASVDLNQFGPKIEAPSRAARESARDLLARLAGPGQAWLGPAGAFEELATWLAGVQGAGAGRRIERPKLLVFAGDHGVAGAGVSALPAGQTVATVRDIASGGGSIGALARSVGAGVRVLDLTVDADLGDVLPPADVRYKVRRGSGRIDVDDAVTRVEAEQAFLAGAAIADDEVDSGADLLLATMVGVAASTPAAVLTGVLTRSDAAAITGRGSGIDDAAWMRKCAIVRDALRRARPLLADQIALLAACGGADFAAVAGFLLEAAVRRTPVIVDGLPATAAALVGQRLGYRSVEWWLAAASAGADPGLRKALDRMGLTAVSDTGAKLGPGAAALLGLPLVRAAADLLATDDV
ncbi:MAG TPA: nicotinate-nucleotide--dimethylbenzimidazole phosphoribosyltransferase [Actinomycetes bacterium]|nr:nicotinate-nucleotide--dimethylbenzimidazole phosphoribosyltransferase [Actinomycetes bacterium]